ncbi:Uncharacterized protein FWK35_00018648 [Aphis craccivora]|uniref:Uncharacterized protein n=1 Tax=Aphis craccivora TaxID=307492 RepID=A0A6G0Y470_APHCR|nr:Uncharacterized protein FWK35_00018648 [Aphis craccivora]
MELIKTSRGYKIVYQGHMYLNIDKPTFLTLNNDHVHKENDNLVGAAKVKCLMIEKAKSSHATPSQIYSEIFANCTTNVLAELPREDYLKRSIRDNR